MCWLKELFKYLENYNIQIYLKTLIFLLDLCTSPPDPSLMQNSFKQCPYSTLMQKIPQRELVLLFEIVVQVIDLEKLHLGPKEQCSPPFTMVLYTKKFQLAFKPLDLSLTMFKPKDKFILHKTQSSCLCFAHMLININIGLKNHYWFRP